MKSAWVTVRIAKKKIIKKVESKRTFTKLNKIILYWYRGCVYLNEQN